MRNDWYDRDRCDCGEYNVHCTCDDNEDEPKGDDMLTPEEIIKAVRAHAGAHYEEEGWDIICECWENEQILATTKGAKTIEAAIRMVRDRIKPFADYRADIQAEAF